MDIGWQRPDPVRLVSDRFCGLALFLAIVAFGTIWGYFRFYLNPARIGPVTLAPRTLSEDFSSSIRPRLETPGR